MNLSLQQACLDKHGSMPLNSGGSSLKNGFVSWRFAELEIDFQICLVLTRFGPRKFAGVVSNIEEHA